MYSDKDSNLISDYYYYIIKIRLNVIYSNYIYNYNYISSIILLLKLYYYLLIKGYREMFELLELLEMTCPPACTCLFKLRPGVLSKTLSHM